MSIGSVYRDTRWCLKCSTMTEDGWLVGSKVCALCLTPRTTSTSYQWCNRCQKMQEWDKLICKGCQLPRIGYLDQRSSSLVVVPRKRDEPIIVCGPVAPREAK